MQMQMQTVTLSATHNTRRELSVVEIGGNGIERQLLLMLYGEEEQVPASLTRGLLSLNWKDSQEEELYDFFIPFSPITSREQVSIPLNSLTEELA